MISRVWKRTLWKLSVLFGIVFGIVAYALAALYIGDHFFGTKEGGLFGFYAAGFLAFIVHWTYKDAKREIENENDELLRQLKHEEYKKMLGQ